mmetsp:Transcript_7188/g.12389  ORF Transcript_7188/g.12389 Transcript_7188/m.12389 type:complete len:164 (+) Transcript_7188:185-676(+)|eukprot:CAMPEP_0119107742 /NCGR_PEP_ID=MMETSP1180-20130426/11576_1 /TAXON_ID=3052 ORGANISM="Chlamydomonas cf sp, Strain CCMP681" /NCGR_SAMPLE_ID=MMETSP1180 /ASSEMBLY_ACC=CAM_ASM_000741 /LENGTH=163 /DNA_ID=CAMNT_0007093275 /DNA_START=190 /DNA_END=681 /DNA_ORIENTATION=-
MLLNAYTAKPLLVLAGYVWPGYQTYKAVAGRSQQLTEYWALFWMVMGFYLAMEWIADSTIFWLPLYHEAKLLIILFLWHPRTQGAALVYDRVLHPLLSLHEAHIDSSLAAGQARLADSVTRQVDRVRTYAVSNTASILDSMRNFSEGNEAAALRAGAKHLHKE